MKKITFYLLTIISLLTFSASAQTPLNGNGQSTITISLRKGIKPSNRPKDPSEQDIEACYQNGNVYIYFSTSEGMADVTVTNLSTGDTTIDRIDTSTLGIVYIGSDTGYYTIEIDTDSGNTYSGDFTL